MRRLPPLHTLDAFDAVARRGSVLAASEELRLTPSAVSHRLRRLELHLGAKLFHRQGRRVVLSDAGRDYLRTVSAALDRIERASEETAGADDVLTVHCPPSFAPARLLPRLSDFLASHPRIALRVHASPEPADFFRSDTDVEIRYGNADWAGLVVVPLMEDRVVPLCAPPLLERHGAALARRDFSAVPLIHSERAPIGWEEWMRQRGIPVPPRRGLRFDRGYLAVEAACLGHGVALEEHGVRRAGPGLRTIGRGGAA